MEFWSNSRNQLRSIILLAFMVGAAIPAHSQNGSTFLERLIMDYKLSSYAKFNEDTPVSLHARWGYRVYRRFGVLANIEANYIFHHQAKGIGEYQFSNNWGGGVTYRLKDFQTGSSAGFSTVDVYAIYGTTLGHYDWKYNSYDVGFSIGLIKRFTPSLGFGYRIMDTRTSGVKTYRGFYVSLGFSL